MHIAHTHLADEQAFICTVPSTYQALDDLLIVSDSASSATAKPMCEIEPVAAKPAAVFSSDYCNFDEGFGNWHNDSQHGSVNWLRGQGRLGQEQPGD